MSMRVGFAVLGAAISFAGVALAAPLSGHDQFVSTCSACHRENGMGVPGAFPALAKDKYVDGPAEPVVATVLNGRAGMPSFKADLTDAQIAAALTYVRSSWGNTAPPVTAAFVHAERVKTVPAAARGLQVH